MERFPNMSDGNINISDVLDAIETADPSFVEQTRCGDEAMQSTGSSRMRTGPYVEIVEQPAGKALRFRYECEGRSAGSIPGVNSTPENKTFPTIRIVGYKGRAIVVVSCVTKDYPYRPHPHNLVGKEVCRRGVCTVEVPSENMTVSFDKLGIQCVKRKDIEEALKLREENRVDPFRTGFDHKRQPTSIDLNAVRLCFQVFVEGQERGKFTVPLQPIVSEPIYDKKAMSDLVICKLSHCTASVAGGTEMVLLCEKVAKEDIQVRFFEERDGQIYWEAVGDFQPSQVHKQVAISFRTPSYRTQQVDQPVQAYIQLRRPSDGALSDPLPFQLLPLGLGRSERIWSLSKSLALVRNIVNNNHIASVNNSVNKVSADSSKLSTTLNRDIAYEQLAASKPMSLDEFNNNQQINEEMKHAYSRKSALRALNDINNIQRNSQGIVKSDESPARDAKNNDIEIFIDDDKTVDSEKNVTIVQEVQHNDSLPGELGPEGKSIWYDYSQVDKWVEKSQPGDKELDDQQSSEMVVDTTPINGDKSLDDLLDKIYEDTHMKLINEQQQFQSIEKNNCSKDSEPDVPDNMTYTSMQMAMKNPVWVRVVRRPQTEKEIAATSTATFLPGTTVPSPIIAISNNNRQEDVAPPRPPPPVARVKRDVSLGAEEPLPPLPPKRIRKTPSMPALPRASSQIIMNQQTQSMAPEKNLPTLPNKFASLPKQNKSGLFSRLFSKKPKKENIVVSTTSLPGLVRAPLAASAKSLEVGLELQLESGQTTPPYGAELTEAEHYALYTTMAPRATVSEFDEMSFYYSPVEGGKIMEKT